MVSLTLSDSFCVDRHRDDFRRLVRDEVDLLFGNDDELLLAVPDRRRSTTRSPRSARDCELAAITCGADGLVRRHARRAWSHVAGRAGATRVLDTTGAGDLYAAGFLFGYTPGRDLDECGRLGSIAAAEVISHVGPRPLVELRTLIG